jgi:hypothetical protein
VDQSRHESVHCPCCEEEVDLSGVSRAALLEIVGGVARGATRVKTALQISLSGARLMAYSRNDTTDLMSKSSESTTALNLERSPKRVPRLLGEESRRAVGRVCKASIRSSTRFLRPMHVRKRAMATRADPQPQRLNISNPLPCPSKPKLRPLPRRAVSAAQALLCVCL